MSTNQINGFLFLFSFSFPLGVRPVLLLVATIDHCQTRTTAEKLTFLYQRRYSNESRWPDQSSGRGAQLRPEGVPARPAQAGRKHPSANPCQRKQRIQGTTHRLIAAYSVYNTFSRVCSLCTLFLAKCLYNFRLSTCAFETISKELIRKKQKKKNFYKLQEKKTFEG
jgi:hypothetical protein